MESCSFREMRNGTKSCNPREYRARGICIVIDNDADNLYITVTARALNPNVKIITRAGQQRYANPIRNSGADEVIIPRV